MIGLLEKSVNILVVVASWNDISDLLKFGVKHFVEQGSRLVVRCWPLVATPAGPPISSKVFNAECLMNVRWTW